MKKAGGKNYPGNLPGWCIDGDDEMREDINVKGADIEFRTSG